MTADQRIATALERLRQRGCDVDLVVEARKSKTLKRATACLTHDPDPVEALAEQLETLVAKADRS